MNDLLRCKGLVVARRARSRFCNDRTRTYALSGHHSLRGYYKRFYYYYCYPLHLRYIMITMGWRLFLPLWSRALSFELS